jgi:hypothetical protein
MLTKVFAEAIIVKLPSYHEHDSLADNQDGHLGATVALGGEAIKPYTMINSKIKGESKEGFFLILHGRFRHGLWRFLDRLGPG